MKTLRYLSLAVLLCASNAGAAVVYSIRELGTLGGSMSLAYGINNNGEVTGTSTLPGDTGFHAFRTNAQGVMSDAGTLGTDSEGRAINDSGLIAGYSDTSAGTRAFRTNADGSMSNLGVVSTGSFSFGYGINNLGQVVGMSNVSSSGGNHPFRTDANGQNMTDLGTFGGTRGDATDINDNGQVVGCATINLDFPQHAFRTNAAGVKTDLGTLGGAQSFASAINEAGEVVGSSQITLSTTYHAFKTDADGSNMIDLGTLGGGSDGFDINDFGAVVGRSQPGSGVYRAVLVPAGGGSMVDLNTLAGTGGPSSPWILQEATGINNAGQICGVGQFDPDGRFGPAPSVTRAFLLTPIPEPSSLAGILLASVPLAGRRQRRSPRRTVHLGKTNPP